MKIRMKVAIVTAIISSATLSGCAGNGKTEINISDYLTVECSGYSTVAIPDANLSIKDMITTNPEAFGLDKDASVSEIQAVGMDVYNIIEQHESIMQLNKTEKIANGDIITVTWNQDALAAIEDKYSVKWIADEYTFTVDGLTELTPYNPFDYLHVSFQLDKYGSDKTKYQMLMAIDEEFDIGILFKTDNESAFTIAKYDLGDTVKVIAYVDFAGKTIEEYCAERGYLIEQTEKEFVVTE
ncbi:MAG: hypothetical protein PUC41_05355 [Oscillospiraceae bacterium]|nr:hypothetical protein [Oscillospiraceae bacterium]